MILIQTVVVGVVAGSIYALIAAGITLVYKSSRALNFAQVEIGTLSLYATYYISGRAGLPWIVGALASVAAAVAIGLVFEAVFVRRMMTAPRVSVAVATIGMFSLLLAVELQVWSGTIFTVPTPLPAGGTSIAGAFVSWSQWLGLGVVAVIALLLAGFFRYTDFGLAVMASADDPVAAQLMGTPRARISAFTWGMAGLLSAVAVLFAGSTVAELAPGAYDGPLFIGGLTAALVGGLTSLSGAFVGGLAVGVVEALVKHYVVISSWPNLAWPTMLVIVLAVLMLRPQGLLGRRA
jgi:branched-chain amino acid transport system permease protein